MNNIKYTKTALTIILLIVFQVIFALLFINFSIHPFEDSAMLMRYAEHLGEGYGIVWNIGDKPVDGATDFLFMIAVALLKRIGLPIETAVRFITITSHFITSILIYFGIRKIQGAGIFPALLSFIYFTIGPGLYLSAAYFGTSFFILFIALAWLSAQNIMFYSENRTTKNYIIFSFICLTAGLIRPEGVFTSIFILLSTGIILPFKDFRRITTVFLLVFLTIGGSYFLWRWNYFGYPLPNPFYKKGAGHIYISSLIESTINTLKLLYPFAPFFLLSIRNKNLSKIAVAFSIPIIGSVFMWLFLSNEMNFGGRFQYLVLPLGVLSWYPLAKTIFIDFNIPKFSSMQQRMKIAVILTAVFITGTIYAIQLKTTKNYTYSQDGLYNIAVILNDYKDSNYTLATTEAGLLPFYSKWRAVDTWGLNDQWIAHNGLVTESYLKTKKPDVIMFHAYFSPLSETPDESPISQNSLMRNWTEQVLVLKKYAEKNNFTLAAAFGTSPNDTHYYYVSKKFPAHDDLVQRIRLSNYIWADNKSKCKNFAIPQ